MGICLLSDLRNCGQIDILLDRTVTDMIGKNAGLREVGECSRRSESIRRRISACVAGWANLNAISQITS